MRGEVTADNTSIGVSWEWSRQDLLLCLDSVRVDYQPEGGSLMYTVDNATATSATSSNLQCNTQYFITVRARGGVLTKSSTTLVVSVPARGNVTGVDTYSSFTPSPFTPPAPPTPTEVTAQVTLMGISVAWQWTGSGSAPSCFSATRVTYHPEGGRESSLQLRNPAGTEIILTGLQCDTSYTITVVATAGEHRREIVAIMVFLPLRGIYCCVMGFLLIVVT